MNTTKRNSYKCIRTAPANAAVRYALLAALLLGLSLPVLADWGRIEISQAMVPYTITNSGSYIVTENLVNLNNSSPVISISTNYVTLDLAGHTLTQMGNNHVIFADHDCITVRNGTVTVPNYDGNYGIFLNSDYNRIENIRSIYFNGIGIATDDGSIINNCVVSDGGGNLGLYGIEAGSGCSIIDCQVSGFQGGLIAPAGIKTEAGCLIANSIITDSQSSNAKMAGIRATNATLIINCNVSDISGVDDARGIESGYGGIISECTVSDVTAGGAADDRCVSAAAGTIVNNSTVSGSKYGIFLGDSSLAVKNVVTYSRDIGINIGNGSLARNNRVRETKIKAADGSMVAGNSIWNRDSSSPIDLVEIGSDCYVLENYLWGWGAGVKAYGDNSRIDRNEISCAPEVNAIGSHNLIVRNLSNSWSDSGTTNDFCGPIVNGSAGMSDSKPWANVDF